MKSESLRQSQKQEQRLAEKYNGSVSAASGAFWSRKGDVRTETFLIEHKYTAKQSISVSRQVLDKISREAVMDSRVPILALHIAGKDYVVLSEDDFDEITGLDI